MGIEAQKLAVVVTCDKCGEEVTVFVPANKINYETILDELHDVGKWGWKIIPTKRGTLVACHYLCEDELREKYKKELA